MQKLLIVESPAKAKTITKYLGNSYKILASCGHVRGIPSRTDAVNVENNFDVEYEINTGSTKYLNAIVEASKNCQEIYMATDPDREGEAIAWHVSEVIKDNKINTDERLYRVVFNEITPNAIKNALKEPRKINMDLVHAQQARQKLDYLVGFYLSPILWRKLPGSKSAGRVQSVALRILCEREHEIMQFKPTDYWTIAGNFTSSSDMKLIAPLSEINNNKIEKFTFQSEESAKLTLEVLENLKYSVKSVDKKDTYKNPDPPFITSTLIQSASRLLKMSAKRVMQVAQKLYEGVEVNGKLIGLITYMRTDSVNISPEAISAVREVIESQYGEKYLPKTPRTFKKKVKNAQEAHEAIRPTDPSIPPTNIKDTLSDEEWKLYDLIWKRFVACQMSQAIIAKTTVTIQGSNDSNNLQKPLKKALEQQDIANLFEGNQQNATFRVIGTIVVFDGFYKLTDRKEEKKKNSKNNDDNTEDSSQELPPVSEEQVLEVLDISSDKHTTTAPSRYSEATLVKKMEDLGIGRPSTYATIIGILQDRKYAVLQKNRFHVEDRGEMVNAFLNLFFAKYVEYGFTASLEEELDEVANGEKECIGMLRNFWQPFKQNVSEVSEIQNRAVLEQIENTLAKFLFETKEGEEPYDKACPKCKNGELKLKNSKYSPFIGCSNYPTCDYAKKFSLNKDKGADSTDLSIDSTLVAEQMVHNGNIRVIADDGDKMQVMLNNGQYGYYLSLCDKGVVVKNFSLPKTVDIDSLSLTYEQAKKLFEIPFKIGQHPESGDDIKIGIGRYGPYVLYKKKFYSIKKKSLLEVIELSVDTAVAIIASK